MVRALNAPLASAATLQVREQAKAFLQKPEDHMQGLNLINSTNLDYFQPQHQAEMINLKAQFFAALGDSDTGAQAGESSQMPSPAPNTIRLRLPCASIPSGLPTPVTSLHIAANGMFSEALTLWPLCWEAWMAWGKFCDGMYDKSKEAHWLEFLATCYLQARASAAKR